MRLELTDPQGYPIPVILENVLLVPELAVNLFSTQRMRLAGTRLVYPVELGTVWMVIHEGRYVGTFEESATARLTLTCGILYPADQGPDSPPLLLPPPAVYPFLAPTAEVLFAATDIGLLQRRTGHAAVSTFHKLARPGFVRGLEGGLVGELGVCRGCKLGKPLAKPHPQKDPAFRARKPLDLVHAGLAGPIKPANWGGKLYVFVLIDD